MARPIAYDPDQALDKAVLSFWAEGFAGCDVEKLTRTSGLNRHSLYKAFGGKKGLFLQALQRYVDRVAEAYVSILDTGDGLDAIVAYFERATGETPDVDLKGYDVRGCMITNTLVELGRSDPDVAKLVDSYYGRVERAFADLIVRGQAAGDVRAALDPQATARWLRLTSQGISVSARFGAVQKGLADTVRAALAVEA